MVRVPVQGQPPNRPVSARTLEHCPARAHSLLARRWQAARTCLRTRAPFATSPICARPRFCPLSLHLRLETEVSILPTLPPTGCLSFPPAPWPPLGRRCFGLRGLHSPLSVTSSQSRKTLFPQDSHRRCPPPARPRCFQRKPLRCHGKALCPWPVFNSSRREREVSVQRGSRGALGLRAGTAWPSGRAPWVGGGLPPARLFAEGRFGVSKGARGCSCGLLGLLPTRPVRS